MALLSQKRAAKRQLGNISQIEVERLFTFAHVIGHRSCTLRLCLHFNYPDRTKKAKTTEPYTWKQLSLFFSSLVSAPGGCHAHTSMRYLLAVVIKTHGHMIDVRCECACVSLVVNLSIFQNELVKAETRTSFTVINDPDPRTTRSFADVQVWTTIFASCIDLSCIHDDITRYARYPSYFSSAPLVDIRNFVSPASDTDNPDPGCESVWLHVNSGIRLISIPLQRCPG